MVVVQIESKYAVAVDSWRIVKSGKKRESTGPYRVQAAVSEGKMYKVFGSAADSYSEKPVRV